MKTGMEKKSKEKRGRGWDLVGDWKRKQLLKILYMEKQWWWKRWNGRVGHGHTHTHTHTHGHCRMAFQLSQSAVPHTFGLFLYICVYHEFNSHLLRIVWYVSYNEDDEEGVERVTQNNIGSWSSQGSPAPRLPVILITETQWPIHYSSIPSLLPFSLILLFLQHYLYLSNNCIIHTPSIHLIFSLIRYIYIYIYIYKIWDDDRRESSVQWVIFVREKGRARAREYLSSLAIPNERMESEHWLLCSLSLSIVSVSGVKVHPEFWMEPIYIYIYIRSYPYP